MSYLDEKPTCCGKIMTENSPWYYTCPECSGEAFPHYEGGQVATAWDYDCPNSSTRAK